MSGPPPGISAPPDVRSGAGGIKNARPWWKDLTPDQQQQAIAAMKKAGLNPEVVVTETSGEAFVRSALVGSVSPDRPQGPPLNDTTETQRQDQIQPVNEANRQKASQGPAGNYLEKVISIAEAAGVPWQILYAVVKYETHGTWDPDQEGGLAGINMSAHPEMEGRAKDPDQALHWAASQLEHLYAKYHNWSLTVYGYQDGTSMADSIYNGTPQPGAAQNAKKIAAAILGTSGDVYGLDVLSDFTDFTQGTSASSQGRVIGLPDPADVRAKAKDFFKGMFLTNPTDAQLDSAVAFANYYQTLGQTSQYSATAGAGGRGAYNPFSKGTAAVGNSAGIMSPVPLDPDGKPFPITQDYHGDSGGHPGVDIGVPEGTPVLAPVSGTVEFQDEGNGSYGLSARIVGDDGKYYILGHLSSQQLALAGKHVNPGTQLGLSGSTGESTGPHLHFEVRDGKVGKTLNSEEMLQGATPTSAAGVAAAAGGKPGDRTYQQYDWQQRMYDEYSKTDAYKQLYGKKPAYIADTPTGDQQYQNEFITAARSPFSGNGSEYRRYEPDPGAIQQGMITGDPDVARQYEEGTAQALQAVPFREKLAAAASVINRLL